jgi:hypothetical protein
MDLTVLIALALVDGPMSIERLADISIGKIGSDCPWGRHGSLNDFHHDLNELVSAGIVTISNRSCILGANTAKNLREDKELQFIAAQMEKLNKATAQTETPRKYTWDRVIGSMEAGFATSDKTIKRAKTLKEAIDWWNENRLSLQKGKYHLTEWPESSDTPENSIEGKIMIEVER